MKWDTAGLRDSIERFGKQQDLMTVTGSFKSSQEDLI